MLNCSTKCSYTSVINKIIINNNDIIVVYCVLECVYNYLLVCFVLLFAIYPDSLYSLVAILHSNNHIVKYKAFWCLYYDWAFTQENYYTHISAASFIKSSLLAFNDAWGPRKLFAAPVRTYSLFRVLPCREYIWNDGTADNFQWTFCIDGRGFASRLNEPHRPPEPRVIRFRKQSSSDITTCV